MGKIRVALVGLSASAKTSWAAQGHLPYLLSARGREKYAIVALCNSSAAAAKAAIEHFGLPAETKAYHSPEDLAADPDIDLVVVNTRVDLHGLVATPSIAAGKAVWVEWPLAENLAAARQMRDLAVDSGATSIIGLQGRYAPVVQKVQEVIAAGTIGKVVSADMRALRSFFAPEGLPESLGYFTDIAVGGNFITVVVGHVMDFIHAALGEYTEFSSQAQIQRPHVQLLGPNGNRTVTSNAPDMVTMHGKLPASSHIVSGATLSVNFRLEPPPFPGEPAFVWTIYGETGDVRVTSPSGPFLHTDSYTEPIAIEVFDHATAEVQTIDWDWAEWQKELLVRGRSTAEIYERFATGAGGSYPTFEQAIVRHEQMDQILRLFSA